MSQARPVTEREDPGADAVPVRRKPGRPRLTEPSPEFVARREEMLTVAAAIFHERGYDAGSLDDLADALDLRRASLYHYIKSKNHLLYLLFERAIETALDKLAEYEAIDDPRDRLEMLIRHQILMVAGEPSLFSVFFDNKQALEERYVEEMRTKERRYIKAIRSMVQSAADAGVLPVVDTNYAAQLILGLGSWTYKWYDPARHDPAVIAETAVQMVLGPDTRSSTKKRSRT